MLNPQLLKLLDILLKIFVVLVGLSIILLAFGFTYISSDSFINSLPQDTYFSSFKDFLKSLAPHSLGDSGRPLEILYGSIYTIILTITLILMPGRKTIEVFLFLLTGAIPKQREDWGIIFNRYNGKTVPFASIYVKDMTTNTFLTQTVSDLDGRYRINVGTIKNNISLTVKADGFENVEVMINTKEFIRNKIINENISIVPLNSSGRKFNIAKFNMEVNKFYPKLIYIIYFISILIFFLSIYELQVLTIPVEFTAMKFIMFAVAVVWNSIIIYERLVVKPGKVISLHNNLPVSGARINVYDLDGKHLGTFLSDQEGHVNFNLSTGSYLVSVNKQGYALINTGSYNEKIQIQINSKGYMEQNLKLALIQDSKQEISSSDLMNPFS